jgi:hypothetical protein
VLDLDDLGAEARQQLGRVGQGLHLLRSEDPDTGEGTCHSLGSRLATSPSRIGGDRTTAGPLREDLTSVRNRYTGRMRGIISAAGYVPYWRLERSAIGAFHGGRGRGTRTVASYDEDTTTLAVEAGRLALKGVDGDPETLWFATVGADVRREDERDRCPRGAPA